jgi:hypothetical protein
VLPLAQIFDLGVDFKVLVTMIPVRFQRRCGFNLKNKFKNGVLVSTTFLFKI